MSFRRLSAMPLIARFAVGLVLLALALPSLAATGSDTPDGGLFGKRVALVIGNGAYGDLGTLPNPPRDAADMAARLADMHFEVIPVINGDRDAMRDALRRFQVEAVQADVALVYYAGHGLAMNGQNYLVPIGAQISLEPDVEDETISLEDVRRRLDFTGAKVMIVILDACRNNPLAQTLRVKAAQIGRSLAAPAEGGLAQVNAASGMMIAYATDPGKVAFDGTDQRNSPFTKALLDNIATPQIDVRVMFSRVRSAVVASTNSEQRPWVEDGMEGEFQFNPVPPEPEKPKEPERSADLLAWPAIRGSSDPAVFESFIATYPDSVLIGDARDRLVQLRDPAAEAETWKKLAGTTDTAGYEIFLRRYPQGDYAQLASFTLQGLAWQQIAPNDLAAMQDFLRRFPTGSYSMLARHAIEDLEARQSQDDAAKAATAAPALATSPQPTPATVPSPPAASPGTEQASLAPDKPQTTRLLTLVQPDGAAEAAALARTAEIAPASVQFALVALGYYDGQVDGKFGPASRKAAARYQAHLGTEPTGTLQPREIVTLIAAAADAGDPGSETVYGLMYAQGQGVQQDYDKAATWLGRAAAAGNGYGQMNLGVLYRDGLGVAKDPAEARRLFRLAADNGVQQARTALQSME